MAFIGEAVVRGYVRVWNFRETVLVERVYWEEDKNIVGVRKRVLWRGMCNVLIFEKWLCARNLERTFRE